MDQVVWGKGGEKGGRELLGCRGVVPLMVAVFAAGAWLYNLIWI